MLAVLLPEVHPLRSVCVVKSQSKTKIIAKVVFLLRAAFNFFLSQDNSSIVVAQRSEGVTRGPQRNNMGATLVDPEFFIVQGSAHPTGDTGSSQGAQQKLHLMTVMWAGRCGTKGF